MNEQARIFITGVAGTGKTAVADELSKRGLRVIDVDHVPGLCMWAHKETGEKVAHPVNPDTEFIDTHEYFCDMDMLASLMKDSQGPVFVFGCVEDNKDLLPLSDKVILLQCPPQLIVERLKSRKTNNFDFAKDPKVREMVIEWRKVFDNLMLQAGAVPINASQSLEGIVQEVLHHSKI